jgi:hypothetical protein
LTQSSGHHWEIELTPCCTAFLAAWTENSQAPPEEVEATVCFPCPVLTRIVALTNQSTGETDAAASFHGLFSDSVRGFKTLNVVAGRTT